MTRTGDHVDAFNHAVATGDWDTFAARFAVDAEMSFTGVPVGPFRSREAIAAAYRQDPPSDTMSLLDVREDGGATVARFCWSKGGAGTMVLTWAPDGAVQALNVSFD